MSSRSEMAREDLQYGEASVCMTPVQVLSPPSVQVSKHRPRSLDIPHSAQRICRNHQVASLHSRLCSTGSPQPSVGAISGFRVSTKLKYLIKSLHPQQTCENERKRGDRWRSTGNPAESGVFRRLGKDQTPCNYDK